MSIKLSAEETRPSATEVLRMLQEGNRRFVAGTPEHGHDVAAARRHANSQNPIAAVFTCIDSRVTAEALFDQDFGQLIVVRTAGHVPDRAAIGSLEFAVAKLDVPLIVVLGHGNCGAITLGVDAARDAPAYGSGSMSYLVGSLYRSSAQALREDPQNPYEAAMRLQVIHTVSELRAAKALKAAYVVGARYDLESGLVRIVD
ncbi:carbonic anhydrase [Actinorhabdospora filicis]|uniref:Carbonic anhydrase n=1 Tax=Actinorhabdospora filicis TaxID=1785913 RepID=A0A9W6SMN8_9ACTN|nr:carbonic anhydrase [Actinorhabdospora filicis]GLZ79735.1 carbonic anhydrase [Actinorhabdospora filicis]